MQPRPDRDLRHAKHNGDLRRRQLLPGSETENLLVIAAESAERNGCWAIPAVGPRDLGERRGQLTAKPLRDPLTPQLGPLLVGENAPDHAIQPEPRILARRHRIQAAPHHQEGLGKRVRRILGIGDPTDRERENSPAMLGVQALKAKLGLLASHRLRTRLHIPSCPARCQTLQRRLEPGQLYERRSRSAREMLRTVVRDQRAILRGAALASVASGVPSSVYALMRGRDPWAQGVAATRAIGTLVWPGTPSLLRGALAHGAISLAVGELLGVTLPRRRSIAWGTLVGLGVGWVNLSVIAPRRYPAIASLPLGPQLADNAAFGAILAATARPK